MEAVADESHAAKQGDAAGAVARDRHGGDDAELVRRPERLAAGRRDVERVAREVALAAAAGARVSSQFSTELQYNRNDVDMPWGKFVVNLSTLRLDYTFSPRMTVRSLTQYNTSTHEINNNIRFNFIYRPGSDIYIVYNDLSQTGLPADVFGRKDRQFLIKATYLLQK